MIAIYPPHPILSYPILSQSIIEFQAVPNSSSYFVTITHLLNNSSFYDKIQLCLKLIA